MLISFFSPPVTYTLDRVCPQLNAAVLTNITYTENDVNHGLAPENKVIRLGMGTAAYLEEETNHTIFAKLDPSMAALDCVFEVTTGPESEGLLVVVSHLNALRRWRNESCQDYVQIMHANFQSERLCGESVGQDSQSIRSFDSSVGSVQVRLHFDQSDELSRQDFRIRLKLVFTSYYDCIKEPHSSFSCTNTNQRCIPKEYVRDGIINCGVPNCRDEPNCFNLDFEAIQNNVSATILIGLGSFISTGLLFGFVLWCCLRRSFKQGQQAATAPPTIEMQLATNFPSNGGGGSRTAAGSRRARRSSQTGGPSAEGATGTTLDQPPSYHILFPDK